MDPLLGRFARTPGGRVAATLACAGGVAVLAVAIVLASAGAAGDERSLPSVAVERAAAPSPTPMLVHVSGAVRRPGLVSLPQGARVIDAVAAAGGPADRADPSGVNLAAAVVDGQQVVVPERGQASEAAGGGGAGGAAGGVVAVNSATAAELETLPGIGPALAARIVEHREANGPFRSIDALGDVSGIGPATLAGLRDAVTL